MIILDSDCIIAYLRGKEAATAKLRQLPEQDKEIATTCINIYEVLVGERLYGTPASLDLARKFLASLQPLPFEVDAAEQVALLDAEFIRKGNRLEVLDLMIAAIAVCHEAILVTNNRKHFDRVKNLKTDGW
ncbi:MAG TPA: type II toxin-antitoxin system VapC family toxin [Candidatus Diapherotrites archaeon]|uniref:Ribonuclease VapC n=1 Tax=Candidatus Iainarchaeum sp. TaxID=3101447 RepID=A0A7J4JH41_9ARCH|nr:type II toxin-antitoxin system VapC family toxin [Candidatus Diapherotrites archaeon]HIH17073.1 type II toxin-antitoxin system VapC family toxin [Candidatus Diapherotrites archaeon]